jgi:hypothetical protein
MNKAVVMRMYLLALAVTLVVFGAVDTARAQEPPAGKAGSKPSAMVPVRVQVVIARYRDDKVLNSMPYMLTVNATESADRLQDTARVRMGMEVPMPAVVLAPSDGKPAPSTATAQASQFRAFGTKIDCSVQIIGEGRYRVNLTIEESTLYSDEDRSRMTSGATPVLRSFQFTDVLLLKDGQSEQVTAAPDRMSGEVVRVNATLSVLK